MKRRLLGFVEAVLLIVAGPSAFGADSALPRVFCLSQQALAKSKARLAAQETALRPALNQLLKEAQAALKVKPCSVVDNDLVPPSGDKHDYISFGPYWWPDPTKKDGLPFIRRDGEVNPESKSSGSDSPALGRMSSAVQTLALAYYFSDDQRFAEHAAKLLRTWFLDPQTRMKPHLQYGQGIPGREDGRATGIIDTVALTRVVDAVGLLHGSPVWQE